MKINKTLDIDRRRFLQNAALAGLALPILGCRSKAATNSEHTVLFTKMGINAGFDKAAAVAEEGADFMLHSVGGFLRPNKSEAEFEKQLRRLDASPIPVLSCNSFLRGPALRSVGPEAKTEDVLRFAGRACQRAKRAGVERIVFGSSGSRRIPDGWSQAQADEQFIPLLKKMGDLAGEAGIVIAVENLQQKECNYLTKLSEVGEIVTEVNHSHIRMLADLYHGSVMQDPPAVLKKYAHLIDMVEIAEAKGRTVPGVSGQDFRPYFQALREGGYRGPIEIEGKWEVNQVAGAFATIRQQAASLPN